MEEARSRRPSYSQANCIRPIQLPKIYSKVQTYMFIVSMYTYLYVFLHLGGRGPSQAELSYSQAKIHCIKPIRIKIFFCCCKSLILCRNRNETVDSFVAQKSRSFSVSQSYKCKIFIKKTSSCFYLLNYLLKYRTQYIYFHRGRAQGFIVH